MNAITQSAQTLPVSGNNREHEEQQYLTFMLSGETYAIGIAGMGKINGKFVIILNIQQVLSMDDMAALAAMGSAPAAELA